MNIKTEIQLNNRGLRITVGTTPYEWYEVLRTENFDRKPALVIKNNIGAEQVVFFDNVYNLKTTATKEGLEND